MNFPVFDLHCDTASALLGEDHNSAGSLKKNEYHIDLDRTKTFPGYAQCFAVYTTPETVKWYGISPVTMFERQLTTIQREVDANKRRMAIAYTPGDIKVNLEKGKASAILTLEGAAGFGYDPGLLEDLRSGRRRVSQWAVQPGEEGLTVLIPREEWEERREEVQ